VPAISRPPYAISSTRQTTGPYMRESFWVFTLTRPGKTPWLSSSCVPQKRIAVSWPTGDCGPWPKPQRPWGRLLSHEPFSGNSSNSIRNHRFAQKLSSFSRPRQRLKETGLES
jgi:hypothetical protein